MADNTLLINEAELMTFMFSSTELAMPIVAFAMPTMNDAEFNDAGFIDLTGHKSATPQPTIAPGSNT